jgi:hypothetical protein
MTEFIEPSFDSDGAGLRRRSAGAGLHMRGSNPWRLQYLLQTRVILHFVAIVIVMLTIWLMVGMR